MGPPCKTDLPDMTLEMGIIFSFCGWFTWLIHREISRDSSQSRNWVWLAGIAGAMAGNQAGQLAAFFGARMSGVGQTRFVTPYTTALVIGHERGTQAGSICGAAIGLAAAYTIGAPKTYGFLVSPLIAALAGGVAGAIAGFLAGYYDS